jgi:hypothetical protein
MRPSRQAALGLLALLAAAPAAAAAQLVTIRSVPVAAGDQFLVHPSQTLGLGGLSVAVDDTLADPFRNPAAGARAAGVHLFGSPVFYSISDGHGSASSLPVGALWGGARLFGGVSLALQQLSAGGRGPGPAFFNGIGFFDFIGPPPGTSSRSAINLYGSGLLGARLGDGATALALGASRAALEGVDGVHLLYGGSVGIEQAGGITDLRLGLLRELGPGHDLEATLLHSRFDMTHDVTYLDWERLPDSPGSVPRRRQERNLDQTNAWGGHLRYVRPALAPGTRVGGTLTANYQAHPKIPNYEIMNIPRDPGHSWAYNLGVGLSREDGPALVGAEVIYEPIWSHTWADSDTAVTTPGGRTIEPGGKTVENDFRFSNAVLRLGLGRQASRLGFQLGVQVRAIRYDLDQTDHLRDVRREQRESWMEWTPSWGFGARFPEFQVRYAGRVTTGTGRPWVGGGGGAWIQAADVASFGSNFIVAPGGPLNLEEVRVLTHQITASVPIR